MPRNNAALELLALIIVIGAGITTFVVLSTHWVISASRAVFTSYVVMETLLPKVWETPPEGVRYDGDDDEA